MSTSAWLNPQVIGNVYKWLAEPTRDWLHLRVIGSGYTGLVTPKSDWSQQQIIDPIHAAKAWHQASFSWIERHTEGDGTMMLRHRK